MQGDCLLASHLLEAQGRGCKDLFCHSREAREVIYHRLLGHDELVQKHATVLSKRGMFVQAWDVCASVGCLCRRGMFVQAWDVCAGVGCLCRRGIENAPEKLT